MGKEAKIISINIADDNGINKITLTCEGEFGHKIQALLYNPSGDFSVPLPNDYVTLIEMQGTGNYIALGNLNNITNVNNGEKKLYSRNSAGAVKASIYLKNDKIIVVNEGTDFGIRYNEMKTQLDQLKADFNNFVTITYNLHKHPETGGVTGVPDVTGTASTVDFTNTKVASLKLPTLAEEVP